MLAPDPAVRDRLLARAAGLLAERRAAEALPLLDRLAGMPAVASGSASASALMRGQALLMLGRWEAAEHAADAALAAVPAAPQALRLRAEARLARGHKWPAADDAAAAVMAAPSDPAGQTLLGRTLLAVGRMDEAIFLFGRVLAAEPNSAAAQLRLGEALVRAGRHAAAEEVLALAAAQQWPGAAALRAQNRLLSGAAAEALELAQAALAAGQIESGVHSILAHALVTLDRLADAAPHFRAAARLAPDNPYLAHLAAAASGTATDSATPEYVAQLFDGYAATFEASLLGLGYRVPGLIRRAVERHWPLLGGAAARLGPVLDLGCGTGLIGTVLWDLLGGPLTGIDLSERMLAEARRKGVYQALQQTELMAALAAPLPPQALIVAADVFCYLGRLDGVLPLARAALGPDGLLMFTVEAAAFGGDWQLGPAGRFAHSADYVRKQLGIAGLQVLEFRDEGLRLDSGGVVRGLFVVARAAQLH